MIILHSRPEDFAMTPANGIIPKPRQSDNLFSSQSTQTDPFLVLKNPIPPSPQYLYFQDSFCPVHKDPEV